MPATNELLFPPVYYELWPMIVTFKAWLR